MSSQTQYEVRWVPLCALIGVVILAALTGFYGTDLLPGHHGFLSAHGLSIAKHVSLDRPLLMIDGLVMNPDGEIEISAYNRFPPTTFVVLRAATWFTDDLSTQLLVGRISMRLFFMGAVVCVYFALRRWLGAWEAFGTALISFSSYVFLYYQDMVFVDTPTLFGVCLCFHGTVAHAFTGNWRQFLVKTAIGGLLGWQVFPLAGSYLLVQLLRGENRKRALQLLVAVTALAGLLVGGLLLNERVQTGNPWSKLSSVESMKTRVGAKKDFNAKWNQKLSWSFFIPQQIRRATRVAVPFAIEQSLPNGLTKVFRPGYSGAVLLSLFVLFVLSVLVLAAFTPTPAPLVVFAGSGWVWALPMRHFTVFHDFQGLYYLGTSVVFYLLLARGLARWTPAKWGFAVVCPLVFIASAEQMSTRKEALHQKTRGRIASFEKLQNQIPRKATYNIDRGMMSSHENTFYLSGRVSAPPERAEYLIRPSGSGPNDFTLVDGRVVTMAGGVKPEEYPLKLSEKLGIEPRVEPVPLAPGADVSVQIVYRARADLGDGERIRYIAALGDERHVLPHQPLEGIHEVPRWTQGQQMIDRVQLTLPENSWGKKFQLRAQLVRKIQPENRTGGGAHEARWELRDRVVLLESRVGDGAK